MLKCFLCMMRWNLPHNIFLMHPILYICYLTSVMQSWLSTFLRWGIGYEEIEVIFFWGRPADRWCSPGSSFCQVQWLFSSTASYFLSKLCWEPRMRHVIDFGFILKDWPDSTWEHFVSPSDVNTFFLLSSLHRFYGFSSSYHLTLCSI